MRASWATITLFQNRAGAVSANGTTGIRKPAATPPRKASSRRVPGRHSTAMTATGTMAHTLTAPAKPSAAPPQASRRVLVASRSP